MVGKVESLGFRNPNQRNYVWAAKEEENIFLLTGLYFLFTKLSTLVDTVTLTHISLIHIKFFICFI